jgi:hypothetical protein
MRIRYILALVLVGLPALILLMRWLIAITTGIMRGPVTKCPLCRSERTRWSKLRVLDLLLPSFVMPRRCDACELRFYTAHSVNYIERAKSASTSESTSRQTSGPFAG